MSQSRPRILTLILAGGEGGRLDVLTERRAKPAMPFAGVYRLIDFPLSNCVHSGLTDVWVVEQYQPHSLNEHLANGRPWDLDRTFGGLQVIPPYQNRNDGAGEGGFSQGNADAIWRNRHFIREFAPDLILVLSADHLYKLDYRDVVAWHQQHEAEVTIVVTRVSRKDVTRFGNVSLEGHKGPRVAEFAYKPKEPVSDLATTEVFLYDARVLLETLDQLAEERKMRLSGENPASNPEDVALRDFGHELLPHLVNRGRAFAYQHTGYWRDLGTLDSYWQGHRDLLTLQHPDLSLDDPKWPILTYGPQRLPARIASTARIEESLISPGCTIAGEVIRSVLSPGVVVEAGAVVSDSVVLHETIIGSGARVSYALLDKAVTVEAGAIIGELRPADFVPCADDLVVVGTTLNVPRQQALSPGTRLSPRAGQ